MNDQIPPTNSAEEPEFKDRHSDLKTESKKCLRRELCRKVDQVISSHSRAHFIAWAGKSGDSLQTTVSIYAHEVCIPSVIGMNQAEIAPIGDRVAESTEEKFINNFLQDNVGLKFVPFQEYINWLMSLAGNDDEAGNIELLFDDPERGQCGIRYFPSLAELKSWIDQCVLKESLSDSPKPTGPRGI